MTDLKPEDPDYLALRDRLQAWAARERRDGDHVRGPAFGQPWGQDIIDRHKQNAADLTLAVSLLADRARMERAIRGYQAEAREVEQAAGKALGYPWFKDDQTNFPGATEADGVCVGEHVAGTITSELADKCARMEKALRDLIPLAQKWEFVESRQFSYGGGGSEPSPAEWGVEVSYQQTREAGPFEQFLADVEAFHKSADEEVDPEHPEWLHDSQIARQALGASQ